MDCRHVQLEVGGEVRSCLFDIDNRLQEILQVEVRR